MPPWLQEVILRCLEVDPSRRHPTAAQLAFDLRNPDQVALTARAARMRRDGFWTVLKRRFDPLAGMAGDTAPPAAGQAAPIVVAAIDLGDSTDLLADAMRAMIRRMIDAVPAARLACVNILKTRRIGLDTTLDDEGESKHVQRLVELRHWARPLELPADKITFHVLEATSPAAALLDYARANQVDHIVMGARTRSLMRSLLGSVSAEVAAEAPCTVTVVRPADRR
ncbi:universal stress protein [Oleomonas cavernae]|uniref:universal stress protein n=1 Tax=Oleomonas cavernae TaxID=2320859 RepID=UPI0018F48356|nr:universal stress protein [Oleomonas cavernae]